MGILGILIFFIICLIPAAIIIYILPKLDLKTKKLRNRWGSGGGGLVARVVVVPVAFPVVVPVVPVVPVVLAVPVAANKLIF